MSPQALLLELVKRLVDVAVDGVQHPTAACVF